MRVVKLKPRAQIYFMMAAAAGTALFSLLTVSAAEPTANAKEDFEVGRLYASTRDFPEAIDHYSAALKKDNNNGQFYFELAHSYYNLDQYIQAIPDYTQCLRLNYKPALTYERRAYCYLNARQYKQGIADCTEAIKLDPLSRIAYFNRGKAYGIIGEREKRKTDLAKVKELDKHPRAKDLYDRGRATHDNAERLRFYMAALKLDKKDPRIIQVLGATCLALGQNASALDCFNTLLEMDKDNYTAHLNRGICMVRTNHFQEALKDLSLVLQHAPHCYEAYYWRGMSYLGTKEGKKALDDFHNAMLIMQPRMTGEYAAKNRAYRKILGHRLVTTYSAMAQAYEAQGELSRAIEQITLAVNQSRMALSVQLQVLQARVALYRKAGRTQEMHEDLQAIKELSDKLDLLKNGSQKAPAAAKANKKPPADEEAPKEPGETDKAIPD